MCWFLIDSIRFDGGEERGGGSERRGEEGEGAERWGLKEGEGRRGGEEGVKEGEV